MSEKSTRKRSAGLPIPETIKRGPDIRTGSVCVRNHILNWEWRSRTHHNRSRLVVENDIVGLHITGEENPVVLDIISDVSGRFTTISVDPLC